jgi:hypothetical protein
MDLEILRKGYLNGLILNMIIKPLFILLHLNGLEFLTTSKVNFGSILSGYENGNENVCNLLLTKVIYIFQTGRRWMFNVTIMMK